MAITVHTFSNIYEFATANSIVISDGHLLVQNGTGIHAETVAIFAPEKWETANKKDSRAEIG